MKILDNNFCEIKFEDQIFRVDIKDSYPNEDEWGECKKALENFYEAIRVKKINFTIMYDITNMGMLQFNHIKELVSLLVKYRDLSEQYVIASVIVVNNSIVKNVVNTTLAMYPSVRPVKFVTSMEEAKGVIEHYTLKHKTPL